MYERLNIKGLEERGESYYQDRMDAVVKLLNEKGEHFLLMNQVHAGDRGCGKL